MRRAVRTRIRWTSPRSTPRRTARRPAAVGASLVLDVVVVSLVLAAVVASPVLATVVTSPVLAAVGALPVLPAVGAPPVPHGDAPTTGTARPTASRSAAPPTSAELRRLLEAARTAGPYLVLDLGVPRLRLMRGGAVLRNYDVLSIEEGHPSIGFLDRPVAPLPTDRLSPLTGIAPGRPAPRTEVVAPALVADPAAPGAAPTPGGTTAPDTSTAEPIIPPAPDEACPAPPRYELRFGAALTIEVVRAPATRARSRFGEFAAVLRPRPVARLRVVLSPEDAGALYRSLPADVPLVIIGAPPART